MIMEKKMKMIEDISDEQEEDIRIVMEKKKRKVDKEMMMEQMLKMKEIERRV